MNDNNTTNEAPKTDPVNASTASPPSIQQKHSWKHKVTGITTGIFVGGLLLGGLLGVGLGLALHENHGGDRGQHQIMKQENDKGKTDRHSQMNGKNGQQHGRGGMKQKSDRAPQQNQIPRQEDNPLQEQGLSGETSNN